MKKVLFLFIFSGIVLGIVGFWYWQKNTYSKEILKLEILGPEKVELAEKVEYVVKFKNNGDVRLEEPRLVFEFPECTQLEEGETRRQELGPEEIGDIYPGEEKTFKFSGRLFGKEGEIKIVRASLTYKPKNLKAHYESVTTFSTEIKSVPLTFDFDLSSKIEIGRDFDFSLNYFSTLDYPLLSLAVRVEYPSGFEFLESNPPSFNNTEWDIPVLNKAEGGRIEIKGRLQGKVKEQKVFRAELGIWQNDNFVLIKEITQGVELTKPQLFVFQRINGRDNYIASPGDLLHYEIFFRNIGEEPFSNLFLAVRLSGIAYDFSTLKSEKGQFNKGDNSIVWDWRDVGKLRFLGQGEEGKVEFWINLKKEWKTSSPREKNFSVMDEVLLSQVKESFVTKINSKLSVFQKGYYQDEVFGNSGPIPPKVGQTTTYTIVWQAKNYYNDLENVRVVARLPVNVRPTGKIFPQEEASNFSYDPASREVVWRIGRMEAGKGIFDAPPNIAFQIAFSPSIDQKGKKVQLIGKAEIKGEDLWTETFIGSKTSAIDTSLPHDPTVSSGVVE